MTLESDTKRMHKLRIDQRVINKFVLVSVPQRRGYCHDKSPSGDEVDDGDFNDFQIYNCQPPPIFIPLVTLAEIAIFIYYSIKYDPDLIGHKKDFPNYGPLIYCPYHRDQVWRFLTYMFVHSSILHLVLNCLLQFIIGIPLELVYKFWRVGVVYILGVIGGSLAHSVIRPTYALVGASGGVYALVGAHFASVILNWEEMQKKWLSSSAHFMKSGVFMVIALTFFVVGDMTRATGIASHFGGLLTGILIGVPLLRDRKTDLREKICFCVLVSVYILLVAAAALFNVYCGQAEMCYVLNHDTGDSADSMKESTTVGPGSL